MELIFLDTSALVKNYADEPGSQLVQNLLLETPSANVYVAKVTGAEAVAALKRKERTGDILPGPALEAIRRFRAAWRESFIVLEIDDSKIEDAMDLAERHGLRGYDAIQLSCAVNLHRMVRQTGDSVTLWSTDKQLNAGAEAEGIDVVNPAQPTHARASADNS